MAGMGISHRSKSFLAQTGLWFDRFLAGLWGFVCSLIAALMILMSIEVFLRYSLNRPTIWSLDVSRYLVGYVTFLGSAWLVRTGNHVRIETVFSLLSSRTQYLLYGITSSISALACLIFTYLSSTITHQLAISGTPVFEILGIPKWIPMGTIPIGSLLLSVEFIRAAFRSLQSYSECARKTKA